MSCDKLKECIFRRLQITKVNSRRNGNDTFATQKSVLARATYFYIKITSIFDYFHFGWL